MVQSADPRKCGDLSHFSGFEREVSTPTNWVAVRGVLGELVSGGGTMFGRESTGNSSQIRLSDSNRLDDSQAFLQSERRYPVASLTDGASPSALDLGHG